MSFSRAIFVFLVLSLFIVINTAYAVEVVIFEEGFESLALGPTIDEQVPADAVWTNTPPSGWTIENNLADGMPEWTGWAFADGAWWTETAGDQERSQFTAGDGKGVGTVAIADPDEWDDLGSPADTFNSWLSTPGIDISGVAPNALTLVFDSSWRPEDTQNAEVTVSFDGGAEIVIIGMESSGTNTIYTEPENGVEETIPDLQQVNETVEINIPNPMGANTVVVTWAMLNATNDWWWAIDNISLKSSEEVSAVDYSGKLSAVWGNIKANR